MWDYFLHVKNEDHVSCLPHSLETFLSKRSSEFFQVPETRGSNDGTQHPPEKCPIHTLCLLHHIVRDEHGRTSSHLEVNSCKKPCRICHIPGKSFTSLLNGSQNHREPNRGRGITQSLEGWSVGLQGLNAVQRGQLFEKRGSNAVGSVYRISRHSWAMIGSPVGEIPVITLIPRVSVKASSTSSLLDTA